MTQLLQKPLSPPLVFEWGIDKLSFFFFEVGIRK